tara:strand:+ start:88 stop:264 length:177 start_codon:yes stop_codon:yes gene_type:complete
MNEKDLYESLKNLNPARDKLGKDRDFQQNIMQCIRYLDNEIKEIKRRLDEETKRPKEN